MCESCPPESTQRTPEEEAAHQKQMAELGARIDQDLARRGTSVEAIIDPRCHGTRLQKLKIWCADQIQNFRLAFGFI